LISFELERKKERKRREEREDVLGMNPKLSLPLVLKLPN